MDNSDKNWAAFGWFARGAVVMLVIMMASQCFYLGGCADKGQADQTTESPDD